MCRWPRPWRRSHGNDSRVVASTYDPTLTAWNYILQSMALSMYNTYHLLSAQADPRSRDRFAAHPRAGNLVNVIEAMNFPVMDHMLTK